MSETSPMTINPMPFDGWTNMETALLWDWLVAGHGCESAERAATEAAVKDDLATMVRTIRAHLRARDRIDLLPLVGAMDAGAIARELREINGDWALKD